MTLTNPDNPLKAIAFFDSRPGHIKQTSGILNSLSEITSLEIKEINITIPSPFIAASQWFHYFLNKTKSQITSLENYNFIIGTGTHTHIPMLTLKKSHNLPVITCMSPSSLLLKNFDLCFVPIHDQIKQQKNIFLTNGPPNMCCSKNAHELKQGLILIGGIDNKSHLWITSDIISKLTSIISKDNTINWTISSSPRTPDKTIKQLKNLSVRHNNCSFIHFKDTQAGWIEAMYNCCKHVWVTADSMSMVYEALSAGCNVGLIPVKWVKKKSKFQINENILQNKGLILPYNDWLNGKSFQHLKQPLNEAEVCAKEILKRWWPNRLQ